MRFARVEGLYFDWDKRRYFVERRVPRMCMRSWAVP